MPNNKGGKKYKRNKQEVKEAYKLSKEIGINQF